jgi:hypothetical protein
MTDEPRDEARLETEEQEDVEGHSKLSDTEEFRLANEESDEDVEAHMRLNEPALDEKALD